MKIRNIFRAVLYVYKQNPFAAIISDVLLLIVIFIDLYAINVGGQFIDETAKILTSWSEFSISEYFISDSFWFLTLGLLLVLFSMLLGNLRNYFQIKLSRVYNKNVQDLVMDKLAKENLQEIESKRFQDLYTYISTYSIGSVYSAYINFSEIVRQAIRAVSVIIILFSSVGAGGFLILLFAFPQAYVEFYNRRKLSNYLDSAMERIKLITYIDNIVRDIANFAEMKVNGTFTPIRRLSLEERGVHDVNILERYKHLFIDKSLLATIGSVMLRAYVIVLIGIAIVRQLSIGQFKALFDYVNTCYDSFLGLALQGFYLAENGLYIEKFFDFMEYQGFSDTATGDVRLKRGTPKLEFQHLDFKYRERETKSLENASFVIHPGEKVAFVGGDGSGKSTLAKLICGLYEVTAGDYVIDGYSIRELARRQLKNKIALVPQNFNQYYFTIRRNITIGNPRRKFDPVQYEIAKKVCEIDKFLKDQKVSEDQVLGKYFDKGMEISPGYWQRIAIARAIYRNKEILVLDEPFTFIDQDSRERILKNIIEYLGDKRTLIYITQDRLDEHLFDKVYHVTKGRVEDEVIKRKRHKEER